MKKIISFVTLLTLGATTVSYASIDKNLKYGQRDKEVTELQEFLIDKGLLKTTPSTYFGLLTFKAVKAYQTSIGVSSTGFVGALTREKINKEIDTEVASSNEAEKAETGTNVVNQNINKNPTTQIVTNNTSASSSDSIYDTDVKYDSLGRKIIITQSPNYKVVDYVIANLVDSNGKLVSGFFYKYKKLFVSNDEINSRNAQTQNVQLTPTVVNDVCKNIEGTQSYVPSGMYTDASGNCLTTQNTTTQQSNQNNNNSTQTNTTPVTYQVPEGVFSNVLGGDQGKIAPNTVGAKIGSFTLKNNSTETVKISSFNVSLLVSGYSLSNLTNITVKGDLSLLSVPVGVPTSPNLTFTPSDPVILSANGIKTFDVYADTGSALSGSVTVNVEVKYIGTVSSLTKSLTSNGTQVATVPMVVMNTNTASWKPVTLGTWNVVGQFTVNADNGGKIALKSATLNLTAQGLSNPVFYNGQVTTSNGTLVGSISTTGSTATINFGRADWGTPTYEIENGKSETFTVMVGLKGDAQPSVTPYVVSQLGSPDTFTWIDVQNGNKLKDGNSIVGYPTNSYETSH